MNDLYLKVELRFSIFHAKNHYGYNIDHICKRGIYNHGYKNRIPLSFGIFIA